MLSPPGRYLDLVRAPGGINKRTWEEMRQLAEIKFNYRFDPGWAWLTGGCWCAPLGLYLPWPHCFFGEFGTPCQAAGRAWRPGCRSMASTSACV